MVHEVGIDKGMNAHARQGGAHVQIHQGFEVVNSRFTREVGSSCDEAN